jgi:putative aldouronate transport system permease protein
MSVVKAKERHVPKGVGLKKLIKSRQLLLMLLPGLVFYILFRYVPMYGILVAFKKYSPFLGFFDSP